MDNSSRIDLSKRRQGAPAPQLRVRSGLRSGDMLEKCLGELDELKKYHQQLVNEAQKRGIYVPPAYL